MKQVFLDPGHGGKDPGAVSAGRRESDDVLRLAKAIAPLLTARGMSVALSRESDVYVPLQDRTNTANTLGADLFVSLHRNSFTSASANGVEVWVYTTAGAADVEAASEILERLADVGIQSNRGVKKGNYHVLRESRMTAVMVELGFITNAQDNGLFDRSFRDYAEAVARGICETLGVPWDQQPPKQLAKIQGGAFTWPDNEQGARQALERIRQLGRELDIPELEGMFLVIPSDERVEAEAQ